MTRIVCVGSFAAVLVGLALAGCSDSGAESRAGIAYNLQVARDMLNEVKTYIDEDGYAPQSNSQAATAVAHRTCVMMLPRAVRENSTGETRKELVAKASQLREIFINEVMDSLGQDPPNIEAGKQAIDKCLAILDEMDAVR